MTRKDYVLIARYLLLARPIDHDIRKSQWLITVGAVANALQSDNPRFNRDTFLRAAGVHV